MFAISQEGWRVISMLENSIEEHKIVQEGENGQGNLQYFKDEIKSMVDKIQSERNAKMAYGFVKKLC